VGDETESQTSNERVGAGLGEREITAWTCFACGGKLIQAHEGDYFHDDDDSTCMENVPVPTSLVESSASGERSPRR
jgi:hypothetical protein